MCRSFMALLLAMLLASTLTSGFGDHDAKRDKWNYLCVSESRVCEAGSETLFRQSTITVRAVTVTIQGSTIPGATVWR